MAWSSSRNGTPITLIAVHTNEGPNPAGDAGRDQSAENLARYMEGTPESSGVSYHKVVDDDSVVNFVPDSVMCWALRSGNKRSLNICMTGYAAMTRAQWLEHDGMLRLCAAEVRAWCDTHGIPKVKLSSADVGADRSGICGHVNWTEGKRDGTHTDPGTSFPWDVFMGYVIGASPAPAPAPAPTSGGGYAGPYRNGSKDPGAPGQTMGPVWRIQDRLKRAYRSYAGHLATDGIYGNQTGDAVGEFQRRSGLTDDEIVGPVTWSALRL